MSQTPDEVPSALAKYPMRIFRNLDSILKVTYKRTRNQNIGFRPSNFSVSVEQGRLSSPRNRTERVIRAPLPASYRKIGDFNYVETVLQTTTTRTGSPKDTSNLLLSRPCGDYPQADKEVINKLWELAKQFIPDNYTPSPQIKLANISGSWKERNWWLSGVNAMVFRTKEAEVDYTYISVMCHGPTFVKGAKIMVGELIKYGIGFAEEDQSVKPIDSSENENQNAFPKRRSKPHKRHTQSQTCPDLSSDDDLESSQSEELPEEPEGISEVKKLIKFIYSL
jgi:hypothetical protein